MIHYEVTGAGAGAPWITLVHGFTQDRRYFAPAHQALAERFRVVAVDLRGHGASGGLPGPYGVGEHASDLLEVLDHEGVGRTHLWGTHTGAAVGLVLAVTRPDVIESLVLEGAMLPGYPMTRTEWLVGRASEVARTKGVPAAIADWFDHADGFAYEREHPEEANAAGHRAVLEDFPGAPLLCDQPPGEVPEVFAELGELRPRVLLYNGDEDLAEYLEVASVLAESAPDATRVEIDRAGGFPLWENPRAVLRRVLDFLN